MKKQVIVLAMAICSTPCFGQGKLYWTADSTHLVYYDATTGPLAGSAVSPTNMPPGVTLVADLYAGTSQSSLSLVFGDFPGQPFSTLPGRWTSENVYLYDPSPRLPGGTTAWFQVQVRDAAYSNATAAASAGKLAGFSQVFSASPGLSVFYPIYQHTSPVFSTWDPGTFNLDSLSPGYMGAIPVGYSFTAPPTILSNPESGRTVPIGAMVKFEVKAQGVPPLSYQWLYNASNVITGATNSILMLTNVQPSQSGDYAAFVANAGGAVTSASGSLNVLAALDVKMVPAITLFGAVGTNYRLDYINISGPVTNWVPIATIQITNTGQLYFDLSAAGQPARFYRLVQVP